MKSFSKLLLDWRTEQRWTQAAACEYLGGQLNVKLSLDTYRAWEYGRNEPHGITRQAIEGVMREPEKTRC